MLSFALFALPPSVLALAMLLVFPARVDKAVTTMIAATALPLAAGLGLRFCGVFVAAAQATLQRQAHQHLALLRALGRTDLTSFVSLMRTFLVRPVSAAAAFVLLESLQDLALPLVLQPFGFNTMSTRVFQYAQTQQVRDCAVWVLCLALVGIYPLFTLARIGESTPDAG
jgi:iron(III) transport system permease protein